MPKSFIWKLYSQHDATVSNSEAEAISCLMDQADDAGDIEFVLEREVEGYAGTTKEVTLEFLDRLAAHEKKKMIEKYDCPWMNHGITLEEYLETREWRFFDWRKWSHHGKAILQAAE